MTDAAFVIDEWQFRGLVAGEVVSVRGVNGRVARIALHRLGLDRMQAAITAAQRETFRMRYHDERYPPRRCDRCRTTYQGAAVYCSLDCALADAL